MTENEINKNNNKISLGENQGAETTLTTDYLEGLRNFKIDNKLKNINVKIIFLFTPFRLNIINLSLIILNLICLVADNNCWKNN